MSQLPLFFALQLLGSWACVALGPHHKLDLCMAMGFLTGLAITVFLSLPLMLVGGFTSVTVVALLLGLLAASVWLAYRRDRVARGTPLHLLLFALGFTALCTPACAWDVSKLTYDSDKLVFYAQLVVDEQGLSREMLSNLHSWSAFQIVAHALAVVSQEDYLYALAPAFTLSLLATLAVGLYRGLFELDVPWRARVAAVGVAIAVLLAVPLVRVHAVYIHANWTSSGYLFAFSALFWLGEIKNDTAFLRPAFVFLLAFAFNRVESPVFAMVFLMLAMSQTRFVRPALLLHLGFTIVLTSWLVLLAAVLPPGYGFITPTRSLLMAAMVVGGFLLILARELPVLQWIVPRLPSLGLILGLAVAGGVVVMQFEVFRGTFTTWQRDLWLGSWWGYFLWPAFVIAVALSCWIEAPPFSRPVRYGIALFFVLVVILAALRDDYSKGRYSGMTRLTLHIVPLATFYFTLVLAPAYLRWRRGTKA